ncbi:MAG: hypothetical protein J6Z41_08805, partial [Prevotella sp.]|nr:hypothetical protein [Prevotella sp.]
IDFTKGSTAPTISVTNSTFYAPTATTKSFYSSQSGQKTTEWDGEATQTFKFYYNTMYNLAPSKNFFTHRQNNQKWLIYDVKYNVFVNCGKSGQVIKGMNGGQGGANPTWIVEGNAFNWGGADASAAESTGDEEEPVKNSVAGIITFTSVETPDFGGTFALADGAQGPQGEQGDPRWTITFGQGYTVTVADGIENGSIQVDKALAIEGDQVTVTATPVEGFELDNITVTAADESNIQVTDGKFLMPAQNVTVSATFRVPPQVININISPAEGDLGALVAAEAKTITDAGNLVGDINIILTEDASYTTSQSIVAPGQLNILCSGNATIDASTLEDPFITLEGSTTFAKKADDTDSDHYLIDAVEVMGVTVNGLKNAFIKDNQKTVLQRLMIVSSVIEMPASNKSFIDFNGKGYVGYVGVLNSTIYAKDKNTGFFAQYGSRPKNVNEAWTQEFDVENSTIVNIANDKNFCDLKQKGTLQNVCTLKNNLFVECGKQNQVVVGFDGGQVSATPEWNVDGNAFNWGGADVSAAEVAKAGQKNEEDIVKNSVAGIITFTSVETPDFGGTFALAEGATAPEALGDPRWTITFEAAPIPQEVLWSSETPTDLVWEQQNITIAPEKFENAKVGDVIHVALQDVLADQDYDWMAQVAFRCTNWNTLESPVSVAGTASVDPKEEATWVITGDILSILKAYGAQINGTGCKTALITLESVPEELGSMQSIWVGNQGGGNIVLDNCHFYNAADFNGVKVGDKILITGVGPQWIGVKYVNGSYAWTDFAGTDVAVTNTYSEENPIVEIEILTDEAAAIFNGKDYHGIVIAMGEDAKGITQIELIPYHEPVVTDINVDVASGEDIGAVVAQAKQAVTENGDIVGNITVNLAENGYFTTSQSIEAPANVTINGISGVVDASALEAPFIQMVALESPTEWTEATFNVSGITVNGLKTAFFLSNSKNYVFTEFNIDYCLVEVAGDVTTIDFTKGSTAPTISVTNSTFYAPTATTKSFYSSQGGQKTTEWDGEATQTFKFYNNTMYNLAPSKNFFSHRQNSQKWLVYDVKYNVFVNCGKSGQVIKGMNGGGSSANPTWIIEGNAFNFDGADTSAAESTGDDEEPVKNSVAGIVRFTSVETPDFGGSILTANESVPEQIGDPRWTLTYVAGLTVTVADDIVGGKVEVDKTLVEAGDVVTVTATPDEDYLLSEVTAVDADNQPVAVSETYEITMPEKSITVSATFVSQVKGLYDFAGAAKEFDDLKTAGQTVMPIEKVSGSAANGTAFYIWEKAEKTDSYRQDFKGYGNYTGEGGFLPTNGDIWMRSGELHSKITNGGLQCDNNKNIVINNIKAGDKIIIEFLQEAPALDNHSITEGEETPPEKVLTWGVADGYGHRTHAVVGDATKSAVSGETTIASGEAIRIVDTECGYFSFIAPKGIVITMIKITEGDVPTDVELPGNINLPETVEGGTIKTDKTEAFAGETVTVTATPNSDFELESLTVTNANGDPIEVGEDGTFTMPDGPVNITATFKQKSATGITEINAESDEWQNMLNDGKWYNLQGVRVQTPTKGVFIHEGKKYVVK